MGGMSYPGGKLGPGVFQRLINEIPQHDVYVAAFAGHDAIAQRKRPGSRNILIDLDPRPLDWWAKYLQASDTESGGPAGPPELAAAAADWELHRCCGIDWLRYNFGLTGWPGRPPLDRPPRDPGSTRFFVFLDPPYLMSTRRSGRIYANEMTDDDHVRLIETARRLPCAVMLCGYESELYRKRLQHWRPVKYHTVDRTGKKRLEIAWCNYDQPYLLHDTRFVGNDKRHRERVRRRIKRLSRTLSNLPIHERQAVLNAIAGR